MQFTLSNFVRAAALACTCLFAGAVQAQEFPAKPVKIINAFPAGGALQAIMQKLTDGMAKELGGEFVVESRPGGGTTIAALAVASAPADGYTLLLTAKTTHIKSLEEGAQYKMSDFAPLAAIVGLSETFFIGGKVPAKTLPELIAYFNEKPGQRPVATGAPGTYTGTLAANVEKQLGVTFNKIPYAGSQLFRDAVLAGTADVALGGTLAGTEDFIASGQIVPLAVFAGQRLPAAPDIPTFAELGYPKLTNENYYGLLAPATTPRPVLEKLNAAIVKVQNDPAFVAEMNRMGFWVTPRNLDEMAKYFADDEVVLREMLNN